MDCYQARNNNYAAELVSLTDELATPHGLEWFDNYVLIGSID
jgi:hypothetical protein